MAQWSVVHRVFAYDAFVKNNESVVKVQRTLRLHFSAGCRGAALNGKTIMRWVDSFRTGTVNKKKKKNGPKRTVTTPENTESYRLNERCTLTTDSLFFTNASYPNTR